MRQGFAQPGRRAYQKSLIQDTLREAGRTFTDPVGQARDALGGIGSALAPVGRAIGHGFVNVIDGIGDLIRGTGGSGSRYGGHAGGSGGQAGVGPGGNQSSATASSGGTGGSGYITDRMGRTVRARGTA